MSAWEESAHRLDRLANEHGCLHGRSVLTGLTRAVVCGASTASRLCAFSGRKGIRIYLTHLRKQAHMHCGPQFVVPFKCLEMHRLCDIATVARSSRYFSNAWKCMDYVRADARELACLEMHGLCAGGCP